MIGSPKCQASSFLLRISTTPSIFRPNMRTHLWKWRASREVCQRLHDNWFMWNWKVVLEHGMSVKKCSLSLTAWKNIDLQKRALWNMRGATFFIKNLVCLRLQTADCIIVPAEKMLKIVFWCCVFKTISAVIK